MLVVVGNHHTLKLLRKVLILPITFTGSALGGGGGGGGGSGSQSVGGSMNSMVSNVGCCSGVTGSTSSRTSSGVIGVAGGGVGSKCGSASFTHGDFIACPGTPSFDRFPRSGVVWVLLLEEGEHMLGAVSRPEHQ